MLEASASEDSASEEGIAAVLPGDSAPQAGSADPQARDAGLEDAAGAMLCLPDMSVGKCAATIVCVHVHGVHFQPGNRLLLTIINPISVRLYGP